MPSYGNAKVTPALIVVSSSIDGFLPGITYTVAFSALSNAFLIVTKYLVESIWATVYTFALTVCSKESTKLEL